MAPTRPLDLVIFGGTGDLAMRKLLPALYHLHCDALLAPDARIVGVARDELDDAGYRALSSEHARRFLGRDFRSEDWESFSTRLVYAPVDALQADSFAALTRRLDERADGPRVFYLSTAPGLFSAICRNLDAAGLIGADSRVVLEKPLGHDLASSRRINDEVGRHFGEEQIYRIDHYLGKEPVQNLLALRFGNALIEPLWRREWVRDVQITVAEQVGVESRGDFYDRVGAMRDMVQNHLLQLLCIVAMEPPASINPDAVRDEKLKILRALRPFTPGDVAARSVRGQYRAGASAGQPVPGYVDEPGIARESATETFVALKAEIDTWRWAGVPFFLRTGKRMQEKVAEIVINFRAVPHSIFGVPASPLHANRMVIRMQPEETVDLHLLAKQPGDVMQLQPVRLNLDFAEAFRSRRLEAYERLLMDVMRGNLTLFVRRDEQEAAWRWVEPILAGWEQSGERPKPYTAGTWGPSASSALLSRDGLCWHEEI
ncbi:glucose-6-phosphate dehydrogenase [Aromatoleum petrolei]|uniref:Glucose-6-phosphate 1-dehydrogenase n=1 Tax=Aromatoleum petrolei TaxID=76116 RepID=A0ABX1MLM9_9RHOO|nr:glucose-6-phosphate dehydrogenase [Aromatoleum petrolei]NMF87251.1 glucose-6-phosphate dehydrogenase [Aromatoleum petrolei]QTQ38495.1 Glucose-6-phosphate 1-dehydrogenase [Aromatoleum petrolei]